MAIPTIIIQYLIDFKSSFYAFRHLISSKIESSKPPVDMFSRLKKNYFLLGVYMCII